MPYLPGTELADASGAWLTDADAVQLTEAGLDFGEILNRLVQILYWIIAGMLIGGTALALCLGGV
jgi:hypothetical protein